MLFDPNDFDPDEATAIARADWERSFAPGTTAYVYTGTVGKALLGGDGAGLPWYGYVGGLAALVTLTRVLTDISTKAVEEIEAAEKEKQEAQLKSRRSR